MISGINLDAITEYSLKDDTENPTIWKLGILPSYIWGQLSANTAGKEVEMAFKLLQMTIKGWTNFNIEYKTEAVSMFNRKMDIVPFTILEQLPLKVITELSQKVCEINGLTIPEQKN